MTDSKEQHKNKALHELMEGEFQELVDIIEQKQILHENIKLAEPPENDPILDAAQRLKGQSEELGAESLAEFFHALEDSARSGDLGKTASILKTINSEFESVRNILDEK